MRNREGDSVGGTDRRLEDSKSGLRVKLKGFNSRVATVQKRYARSKTRQRSPINDQAFKRQSQRTGQEALTS